MMCSIEHIDPFVTYFSIVFFLKVIQMKHTFSLQACICLFLYFKRILQIRWENFLLNTYKY